MRRNFKRFIKKSGRFSAPRGVRNKADLSAKHPYESRGGIFVRSRYEKTCADYLYDNGIEFRYEPLMLLGGRQFRPDFYLPEYNLFLEICGYVHMPHYRGRVALKKAMYEKHNLKAVFIEYNGRGSLIALIKAALRDYVE